MFLSDAQVVDRVAGDPRLRRFMALSKEYLATILAVHSDVLSAAAAALVIDTAAIPDSVLRELEAESLKIQPLKLLRFNEPTTRKAGERARGFYWRGPGEPDSALNGPFPDIDALSTDAAKHNVTNPVVVENP